jgi:hypothetical protein
MWGTLLEWFLGYFKSPNRIQVVDLANKLNDLGKDMSEQLAAERADKLSLWEKIEELRTEKTLEIEQLRAEKDAEVAALAEAAAECERREKALVKRLEALESE